jgi:hypothetical protein
VPDPSDPDVVYVESQDGNVSRLHRASGQRRIIRPEPPAGREVPLQLELADPGLAPRSEDDLLRRQPRLRLEEIAATTGRWCRPTSPRATT